MWKFAKNIAFKIAQEKRTFWKKKQAPIRSHFHGSENWIFCEFSAPFSSNFRHLGNNCINYSAHPPPAWSTIYPAAPLAHHANLNFNLRAFFLQQARKSPNFPDPDEKYLEKFAKDGNLFFIAYPFRVESRGKTCFFHRLKSSNKRINYGRIQKIRHLIDFTSNSCFRMMFHITRGCFMFTLVFHVDVCVCFVGIYHSIFLRKWSEHSKLSDPTWISR